jgi:hypothetical protein
VFDDGLGVSHYTGRHTAPDIDAERDLLTSDLSLAKKAVTSYSASGVGPTFFARIGGGDPYFTNGDIEVSRLVSGCAAEDGARQALPAPPKIAAKNAVFAWLAKLFRLNR